MEGSVCTALAATTHVFPLRHAARLGAMGLLLWTMACGPETSRDCVRPQWVTPLPDSISRVCGLVAGPGDRVSVLAARDRAVLLELHAGGARWGEPRFTDQPYDSCWDIALDDQRNRWVTLTREAPGRGEDDWFLFRVDPRGGAERIETSFEPRNIHRGFGRHGSWLISGRRGGSAPGDGAPEPVLESLDIGTSQLTPWTVPQELAWIHQAFSTSSGGSFVMGGPPGIDWVPGRLSFLESPSGSERWAREVGLYGALHAPSPAAVQDSPNSIIVSAETDHQLRLERVLENGDVAWSHRLDHEFFSVRPHVAVGERVLALGTLTNSWGEPDLEVPREFLIFEDGRCACRQSFELSLEGARPYGLVEGRDDQVILAGTYEPDENGSTRYWVGSFELQPRDGGE